MGTIRTCAATPRRTTRSWGTPTAGVANALVGGAQAPSGNAPVPRQDATIDQVACSSTGPRIQAVPVGSTLTAINSDPLLHTTIHAWAGSASRVPTKREPLQGDRQSVELKKPVGLLAIKCDLHNWMKAYLAVVPHPYFAVTGADGTFHIDALPAGEVSRAGVARAPRGAGGQGQGAREGAGRGRLHLFHGALNDFCSKRPIDLPRHRERDRCGCTWHRPAGPGRFPGLVLSSEIFQQTGPIRRSAQRLAGRGYLVAVPEVFHPHLPPGTVLPYTTEGTEAGNRFKYATPLASYDADARATLDLLAAHPACSGKFGAVGWCLGGHLAFRAALHPEVAATACFYATDLHSDSLGEGKASDSLTRMEGHPRRGALRVGAAGDPHVPDAGRDALLVRVRQSGVRFGWVELNAVHAFMRDEGPRYDPALASSWATSWRSSCSSARSSPEPGAGAPYGVAASPLWYTSRTVG